MVPVTDWAGFFSGIEFAPAPAPELATTNICPPTETYELCCEVEPGKAALNATTGIEEMFPLKEAVVVVASGTTTGAPAAIVPATGWLLTAIAVAPMAALPEVVRVCAPTRIWNPAGRGSPSGFTGIAVTVPLSAVMVVVIDTTLGSSGGLSSLLMKPPLNLNPACQSYTPPFKK